MRMFTPGFVGDLSNAELSVIVAENFVTSETRMNISLPG